MTDTQCFRCTQDTPNKSQHPSGWSVVTVQTVAPYTGIKRAVVHLLCPACTRELRNLLTDPLRP